MIEIEKIKLQIEEIAKKFHLLLVVLFGSQVDSKTHPLSDIDFGFISKDRMDLKEIAQMQFSFSQELRLRNIELVDLKNVPPILLKRVAQKSVLLYEKEKLIFANFKIYALKIFMETKRLYDLRELSLKKFLGEK